jgi:D-psicose/D-tagatose/L-ribulose 3-epimerase
MGAALVGGPVYAPIGYLPGRRRDQEEWKWAVDCIQELGEVLDRHAITLSIEPVNRSETFLIRTAEEAGAFCDAVAHPRVGVTVDTFHANIEEKSISRSIASLGRRLKHVHISENDRGIPGAGHIDFAAVLAALREQKYDGYLMIEGFGFSAKEPASIGAIWGDPDTSPEDVAFKGADYLRLLLA